MKRILTRLPLPPFAFRCRLLLVFPDGPIFSYFRSRMAPEKQPKFLSRLRQRFPNEPIGGRPIVLMAPVFEMPPLVIGFIFFPPAHQLRIDRVGLIGTRPEIPEN